MNAEQKRAWFTVIVGAICVVGYLIAIWFVGPVAAFAVFGLFGLTGLASLIGSREPIDERDHGIARQALLFGAMMSYMSFVLGCMGIWSFDYAWRGQQHVSVHLFSLVTIVGGIVLFATRAIALLVLYGRAAESDHA